MQIRPVSLVLVPALVARGIRSADPRGFRDRIWHERAAIADMFKNGAKVYLCGSGRMATGVKETCARVYAEYKGVSMEQAREWLKEMQSRFATDIFG